MPQMPTYPWSKRLARNLRRRMTDSEGLLWWKLKGFSHKFRRQEPLGRYICDFVCYEARLIIELDGSQHAENQEYDEQRDRYLRSLGFEVLRFWSWDVIRDLQGVCDTIGTWLEDAEEQG